MKKDAMAAYGIDHTATRLSRTGARLAISAFVAAIVLGGLVPASAATKTWEGSSVWPALGDMEYNPDYLLWKENDCSDRLDSVNGYSFVNVVGYRNWHAILTVTDGTLSRTLTARTTAAACMQIQEPWGTIAAGGPTIAFRIPSTSVTLAIRNDAVNARWRLTVISP